MTKIKLDAPSFSPNFLKDCSSLSKHLLLTFNFRSIKFLLDAYGISFGQLKIGAFYSPLGPYIDKREAVVYLLKAGLVGSKQITPETYDRLDEKVRSILAKWPKQDKDLTVLHDCLITQCKERHHFFMPAKKDSSAVDLQKLLELLDIKLPEKQNATDEDPMQPEYWERLQRDSDRELRLNIKDAITYGATVEEALDMDMRLLTMYVHAKQKVYETELNDKTISEIRLAIKIGEALAGSKKVADYKKIDLAIPDDEEFTSTVEKRNAMVLQTVLNLYKDQIAELKAKGLL